MLDVSRTWVDAEGVKKFIENLAHHKINKLHLHLTDDEGWRIEIKSHPELTEIGGFRGVDSPVAGRYGRWQEHYGGYYTQEQMRDIIEFAAVRNIEIIPEIDLPGHSHNLARVRPEVLCNFTPDMESSFGYDTRSALCVSKEDNYKFLEEIFKELAELFPSQYVHIGGDEVVTSQWKKCPDCQALSKQKGMTSGAQLQEYFMNRLSEYIVSLGKKPCVWNEAINAGTLTKQAMVYGWESVEACRKATKAGYKTIVMPGTYFYFDMRQSQREPGHNWAAIFDAKKVLSFSFEEQGFTTSHLKHVAGIEASFFSEIYIAQNPEKSDYLDYMLFPRLTALSEVAWSHTRRSWDEFYSAIKAKHYARMDTMDITYRLETPTVTYTNGSITASVADGSTIYYTELPSGKLSRYNKPISTSKPYNYEFFSRRGTGISKRTGSKEYYARLTPAVTVTSSIPCSSKTPMTNAAKYNNSIVRTTRAAKAGDYVEYRFAEPLTCREIGLQTGHIHLRRCIMLGGYIEVSYDGNRFTRVVDLYEGGGIVKPTAPVHAVRVVATSCSDAEDQIVIHSLNIK
jgi:hexosaminidase